MFDRSIRSVGIAIFLICLLGPGTAFATLKCQCNNGTISHAMGADFDDDDAEESCNDACSSSGDYGDIDRELERYRAMERAGLTDLALRVFDDPWESLETIKAHVIPHFS